MSHHHANLLCHLVHLLGLSLLLCHHKDGDLVLVTCLVVVPTEVVSATLGIEAHHWSTSMFDHWFPDDCPVVLHHHKRIDLLSMILELSCLYTH